MIQIRFACLLFAAFSTSALALDAVSHIDAVALYPSGATITRVAPVDLPAGTTRVRLTGLVSGLDPGRIRVEAAANDIIIGQVRFAREQQREAFNAEIERLNSEIRTVETRIAAIDDAVKSAELRLKFLDSLATGYAKEAWYGGARGDADIGTWREALTLLKSASADAFAEIRERKAERTEAERDLSVLQRELESLRGGALTTSVLEVSARTPRELSTELRMHYFQDNARWSPRYEARLDSDAPQLILIQQAMVSQGTDEPWRNVSLSLSTSEPSGDLDPGTIDSEFLDLRDPQRPVAARERMSAPEAQAFSLDKVAADGRAAVTPQVGNFAVTYQIPGRVTVANNVDESQSFDVSTMDFDVDLVTRVMPRRSERAFLAARFDYDRNVPLYASTMRVYVDSAYAGMTEMPMALPNSAITMPMGADRRVEVTVTDQGKERGQEGIVSRRKTETTSYLFEITNRRAAATQVEVIDRYPVARNEDIKVEVPRNATEPTEKDIDDKPGVILWRKSLPPDESWRIEHRYTVTYPADRELSPR